MAKELFRTSYAILYEQEGEYYITNTSGDYDIPFFSATELVELMRFIDQHSSGRTS
jgi:hypothetical protein